MKMRFGLRLGLLALGVSAPLAAETPPVLAGGAQWALDMPQRWNGTLLVWSRGYSMRTGRPESAPAEVKGALLEQGYALAGSDYGSAGWALEQAVPAQVQVINAFEQQYGKPRRIIGWGNSMGGLVTTALAEQHPAIIDGGIAMCASIGGTLGMMNMALDGSLAFRTLIAPDDGIALVGIADDRANGAKVGAALALALKSPQGRARVALAGVLAGIPGWTSRTLPQPAAQDFEAQVDEIGRSFVMGVFLPRSDQEGRAGQGYSWNSGIDYAAQLRRSGRIAFVQSLYKKAGLSLASDLDRLSGEPRIHADAAAVAYMERNYTPNAHPMVPLLAVQAVGDGMTAPSMQQAYADAAGKRNFASLWLGQAGHCGFSAPQMLTALKHLENRLDSGRWGRRPAGFVVYRAAKMLRPCFRGRGCK